MNFDFSPDQKLFKEEVKRYLHDNCDYKAVRRVLESDISHDKSLWQGLAALGCMGVNIPENYGGSGLGSLALCVIAEEIGRVAAPIPFSSSVYLVSEAIVRYGSEAQKQAWLPKLASGEIIGAFAVSEGMGEAKAQATHFDKTLNGFKSPVNDGMAADIALVLASHKNKPTLVLVDLRQAGVTKTKIEGIDPTHKLARLSFDNATGELLGKAGEGLILIDNLMNIAAVYTAFEQVGGADASLEMAKAYAMERRAFGRVIASYQAIKHKLADMFIKTELARSNAYYAAMMLNDNASDLPLAASTARVAATSAYIFASEENIETHGGIGFTWEANTQFHYRRAQGLSLMLGGQTKWKEKLVSELEKKNGL
jgi:acyl-CoA dehydrogenase